SLNEKLDDSQATDVESSLRRAIQINPTFAPAYDALAIFLAMRRQDLDEARMLELRAISLDPSNVQYLVNSGGILLALGRVDDAVRVGEHALKVRRQASCGRWLRIISTASESSSNTWPP